MDVEDIISRAGGTVELAKRLGVHRTTVLDWRRDGRLPGSRIGQISEALGIAAADLAKITYPPRGGKAA
jgi:transposase-like protein